MLELPASKSIHDMGSAGNRWKRAWCTCGDCFEFLELDDCVILADSKLRHLDSPPAIPFSLRAWEQFTELFRTQSMDESAIHQIGSVTITALGNGEVTITNLIDGTELEFSSGEVEAFAAGVRGEVEFVDV